MRALVIYESMYGNTEAVAHAIADGIGKHLTVDLVEVAHAPDALPDDVVLVVVGAPTHAHGMSTAKTRADAERRAPNGVVTHGDGVREWLARVRLTQPVPATAFDTRIKGPGILWGSAAQAIGKELVRVGFTLTRKPQSFLIDGPTGPVVDRVAPGELEKARGWGRDLAASLRLPVLAG